MGGLVVEEGDCGGEQQFRSRSASSEFGMAGTDKLGFFVLGFEGDDGVGKGKRGLERSAKRAAEAICASRVGMGIQSMKYLVFVCFALGMYFGGKLNRLRGRSRRTFSIGLGGRVYDGDVAEAEVEVKLAEGGEVIEEGLAGLLVTLLSMKASTKSPSPFVVVAVVVAVVVSFFRLKLCFVRVVPGERCSSLLASNLVFLDGAEYLA